MSEESKNRMQMIREAKALDISGIMYMDDRLLAEAIAEAKAGPEPKPLPEKPKTKLDRSKKGWW